MSAGKISAYVYGLPWTLTQKVTVKAGETVAVPAGRSHFAAGVDLQACQFIIVQGVGTYDYVPVEK